MELTNYKKNQMADDLPYQKVAKTTTSDDDDDKVDRLSALPDCILLHILSSFTTKDAAVTSILSTRYRNLFLSIPQIDLSFDVEYDDYDAFERERYRLFFDFIDFANRVLTQRNGASVRKIHLRVEHFVEGFRLLIESLISTMAGCLSNVQELQISVAQDCSTMEEINDQLLLFVLPDTFRCETLVSLSLSVWAWAVPDLVSLPNLKFLSLWFRVVDCIRRFLQGCPLLEKLDLMGDSFEYESESEGIQVKILDISNPSLKELMLSWCAKYWYARVEFELLVFVTSNNLEKLSCIVDGNHKVAKVTIDAPNLSSLNISGHELEVNIVQELKFLDNAEVAVDNLYDAAAENPFFLGGGQHAFKFISELQYVKSLSLPLRTLMALCFSQPAWPTLKNLIKLDLTPLVCQAFFSKALSKLFESSPNLEKLILNQVFINNFIEDEDWDSYEETLPLTFIEHLKEIEINYFKEVKEREFKLVEYFLKNGKSLKKMVLYRTSWKWVPEACDRILSVNKCSGNCEIVFKQYQDYAPLFSP